MRDLHPHIERWRHDGEEIALATVVRVQGSSPRRPGARLAVTRSGRMAGSVSGGCVESDVYERALGVLDDGKSVIVTYGEVDELGLEVGLACGGSIDVLIEPCVGSDAHVALQHALDARCNAVLAVAVGPDALRGRALTLSDGGAVAGGIDPALDDEIAEAAGGLVDGAVARVIERPFRGGTAEIFFEAFPLLPRLFVVGATHTAIPLCRFAKAVGFEVTVIDARDVFATEERFPEADALVRAWPDEAFEKVELTRDCHIVALTHDPKFDLPALALALRSEAAYIGALGSRSTHAKRCAQLLEQGFGETDLARIHTPVGLDIGGRSPEEVALSIVAEMVAVRRGRAGGPLVERRAPIHDED
jgi:xanthine dehydrogenase accessory factor